MIIKQISILQFCFDNPQECKEYQEIYKKKGYRITRTGASDCWYFECEKIEE